MVAPDALPPVNADTRAGPATPETTAGKRLPPLRGDLVLLSGPPAFDGAPTWTIFDRLRGRYFTIGRDGMEILNRWHLGTADAVAAEVTAETTARVVPGQVVQFSSS